MRHKQPMTFKHGLVLAFLWLVSVSVLQADDNRLTKVTSIEGITEYRLDNGLEILLFPDPSKAKVTVNLTLFVGSRHEGYGEAGMAHLLEHMLFKGTPTHPHVPKVLQSRGAQFNGTTWFDRTNYYEMLPATGDNLEFAIRLEADRMVNSFIKAEDLASEMSVVRNEFERGENRPTSILRQRMISAAFEWHNYGRATIGNRADIERVPIKKLKDFYKKHYRTDNAMLVVAGKFEAEKALSLIVKYFGVIARPKTELDKTYTEEPAQDGERIVTLRRVGDGAVTAVLYHICSGAHPDYASLDVLESILTSQPSGRLYKSLVESKKSANVFGSAYALHDPGMLLFMSQVTKGNDPDVVLGTMLDTIQNVVEKGVSEEEVQRAQTKLLKQRELAADDSAQIAIQLTEWAAQGDWRLYFLYRDRVEKVTVQSVQDVATRYLKRNNRTVGVYIPTEKPQRATVPSTPNLAKMIGDYKGRGNVSAGEVFDISPLAIEARTQRLKLPSGIKAALLRKRTRGQAVNLRLTLRYGSVASLRGLAQAAEYLPHVMLRGTKKLTRQQLQDALDQNRVELSANGELAQATFSLQTKRENLGTALKLLEQVLRQPTLPQAELEILKRGQVAALQRQSKEPQALSPRNVRRKMYPYEKSDPRYIPTIEEEIERVQAISIADIQKLHRDFLNGENGELTIVGDFDPDEVLPIVNEIFSGWKPQVGYKRIEYSLISKAKGSSEDILTPGKANAMYFAAMAIPLKDSHPDYPALVIGNFVLGGGSLSSRLADRVRQKEGLSYGIRSGFQARSLDPRAALYIYAISNPANMGKVKVAIREEFDRLLKEGVTDAELKQAKQGYLQSQEVQRTSDPGLAATLASTSRIGRDMKYYAELETKIRDLTAADVVEALRRHFNPDRLFITAAGDFKPPASQ